MNSISHNEINAALIAVLNVVPAIDYNPKWANGTGYFDGAVKDLEATEKNSMVASKDEKGRGILLVRIETKDGPRNVVYFQRYDAKDRGANKDVVIVHAPLSWIHDEEASMDGVSGRFSANPVRNSKIVTSMLLSHAVSLADFSLSEYRSTVRAIENSLVEPVPFDVLVKQNLRKRFLKRIGISIGVAMVAVGTYKFFQSLGVDVLEEIPTEG